MTDCFVQFEYTERAHWPPLAWLATCRTDSDVVTVEHGLGVETRVEFFAEAVWDGDFEDGDFDTTDLIFGSGGRIRNDEVVFVPSSSTIDRLQLVRLPDRTLVSNSLCCLLEAAGADVDPAFDGYFAFFEQTVCRGMESYEPRMPGLDIEVELALFHNLRFNGERIEQSRKPAPERDFGSFEKYRDFLVTSLLALADNMRAATRHWKFELLSTISSGYDSATVAALAREAGLQQTLSLRQSRDDELDSGESIARQLGLDPLVFDSNAWRSDPLAEIPFLAGDAKGEDVYYASAGDVLHGRVLLTGYGGTRVWGMGDPHPAEYQRSDQSGLSLTEYRLRRGFIHCPVTYIGGRQSADLFRISNSPEMSAWDVPGDYSRPICRRILEESGVDRNAFGQSKKAASILFFDRRSFLSNASLEHFEKWRAAHKLNGRGSKSTSMVRVLARILQTAARNVSRMVPLKILLRIGESWRLTLFAQDEHRFANVFPWAMERARTVYRTEANEASDGNAQFVHSAGERDVVRQ